MPSSGSIPALDRTSASGLPRLGASAPRDPAQLHIDRPFLFLVRHRKSGALYFLARVLDPA